MKKLKIEDSTARRLYPTASAEMKQILEDSFGKEFFSREITDIVKTYADACTVTGDEQINETELLAKGLTQDEINYRKLKTVTKALNEGWTPDWTDGNQKKWIPYFTVSPSGFSFDVTYSYYSDTFAGDGSRLCFKNSELANYAGTQFIDIYKGFMF